MFVGGYNKRPSTTAFFHIDILRIMFVVSVGLILETFDRISLKYLFLIVHLVNNVKH
jgi:hypothetical protein